MLGLIKTVRDELRLRPHADELRLVEPDAMDQLRKARIAAQGIEIRVYFNELQDRRVFRVCPVQPSKGLVVFAEPEVSIHKSSGRNVTLLVALFQFR